jgi:hypothetical protein
VLENNLNNQPLINDHQRYLNVARQAVADYLAPYGLSDGEVNHFAGNACNELAKRMPQSESGTKQALPCLKESDSEQSLDEKEMAMFFKQLAKITPANSDIMALKEQVAAYVKQQVLDEGCPTVMGDIVHQAALESFDNAGTCGRFASQADIYNYMRPPESPTFEVMNGRVSASLSIMAIQAVLAFAKAESEKKATTHVGRLIGEKTLTVESGAAINL